MQLKSVGMMRSQYSLEDEALTLTVDDKGEEVFLDTAHEEAERFQPPVREISWSQNRTDRGEVRAGPGEGDDEAETDEAE